MNPELFNDKRILRTTAEVEAYADTIKGGDFFGHQLGELFPFMSPEKVGTFLRKDMTEKERKGVFEECGKPAVVGEILKVMHDYMAFAWEKANNERAHSVSRSINHYRAWLWLIGEDELSREIADYYQYGEPQLRAICEKFGWSLPGWDDGKRAACGEDDSEAK